MAIFDANRLQDAISVINEANPTVAAEISAAAANGSVGFSNLEPSDDSYGGAADGHTVSLDPSIDDPDVLAAILEHEWHHVRQYDGSPDAGGEAGLPLSCQEYAAYCQQYLFMCALMAARRHEADEGGLVSHPYACSQVASLHSKIVTSLWHDCVNDNMGGNGVPPTPPPCPVEYCDE